MGQQVVGFTDTHRAHTPGWTGFGASYGYDAQPGLTYGNPWTSRSLGRIQISTADEWQRFQSLAENWRGERGITSSVTQMVMCPSYQRILTMNHRAVPFILRELEKNRNDPDHWFWALEIITEADPVPVDAYGDTVRMAEAWLSWAEGKYVW